MNRYELAILQRLRADAERVLMPLAGLAADLERTRAEAVRGLGIVDRDRIAAEYARWTAFALPHLQWNAAAAWRRLMNEERA